MPLTDVQVRKAKPQEKPYKLPDGQGLHLYVTAAGSKLWRFRYEIQKKEKLLSIGDYPAVSLAEAREERDRAKRLLKEGKDPAVEKKRRPRGGTGPTFESIARKWHAMQTPVWSQHHAKDVIGSLEKDVFPTLGGHSIQAITVPEVLDLLRLIEGRDAKETARRIRQRMSAIFVFAIGSGQADADPAAVVAKAMTPLVKRKHERPVALVMSGRPRKGAELKSRAC